ncbi:MAG: TIGR03067 domain-containing protein [Planctomycetes bacterium]|nr:TIGR03067 domain-containing protein [Planctomycetota bacterium]
MTRLLALTVCVLALTAVAAEEKAEKAEFAKYTGTWKGVTIIQDGKELPKAEAEAVKLVVAGEKYTFKLGDVEVEGTHKVDPTKKPKQIEAVRTKGPNKGEKMLGIYELTEDTYKVCFAAPGKDRPTEFKSEAGSGLRLMTFKREKP